MDFEVMIGREEDGATWFRFTQYNDALDFIHNYLAQWNNFTPEKNFIVSLRKVESLTPTVKVNTNDGVKTKDVFGKR